MTPTDPHEKSHVLPDAPDGWQYGVIMDDGHVWGCGDGAGGRARQRMRLRYATTKGPCMLPLRFEAPFYARLHDLPDAAECESSTVNPDGPFGV